MRLWRIFELILLKDNEAESRTLSSERSFGNRSDTKKEAPLRKQRVTRKNSLKQLFFILSPADLFA